VLLQDVIEVAGPRRAVEILGVELVGVNAENGRKVVLTIVFVLLVLLLGRLVRSATSVVLRGRRDARPAFWWRQGIGVVTGVVMLIGITSIWFDDPTRLATALGLITAGLAFALQKVVTALAGYAVILRGRTFNVGDRISMGGVRGDVIALGFLQTTILEMGQPPSVQEAEPAMWVRSRQYTGRIVTVSNASVFDEPVFNYTREIAYLWEEVVLPIPYEADSETAEHVLLRAAERLAVPGEEVDRDALQDLQRRYLMAAPDVSPRVYYRLTDNWLELTVRFVVRDHGIREVKDAMTREILRGIKAAGIPVASTTIQLVGAPSSPDPREPADRA
jgi:small-conductance mechanosensitive channel